MLETIQRWMRDFPANTEKCLLKLTINVGMNSEQAGLGRTVRNSEVLVGELGCHAAAGRALQKADLEQVGFVDILDRIDFFAQDCSDRVQTNGAPAEAFDHGAKQFSIHV